VAIVSAVAEVQRGRDLGSTKSIYIANSKQLEALALCSLQLGSLTNSEAVPPPVMAAVRNFVAVCVATNATMVAA
jgi:hypothetical protein